MYLQYLVEAVSTPAVQDASLGGRGGGGGGGEGAEEFLVVL